MTRFWYWISLVAGLLLAALHGLASLSDLEHSLHEYDLRSDACQRLAHFWSVCPTHDEVLESTTSLPAQGNVGPNAPSAVQTGQTSNEAVVLLRGIDRKVHPAPTPLLAAIQIANVICLSFLWFYAFSLHAELAEAWRREKADTQKHPTAASDWRMWQSWWPVAASLIPVGVFVATMFQAYQPAVFVMALVAIIVAAEHYTGLKTQEESLGEQRKDLRDQTLALHRQTQVLQEQSGFLTQQQSELEQTQNTLVRQTDLLVRSQDELERATREVLTVKAHTARILDSSGLKEFIQDVYRAYANAKKIRAIVRFHDIDKDWWAFLTKCQFSTCRAWDLYFDYAATQGGSVSEDLPLATALQIRPGQRDSLDALFVTDLPLPLSPEWKRRDESGEHPLFRDLLGLCWQLIVLAEARRQNGCVVSAWVSRPLAWLHATDRRVFQVVRREPINESSVLTIANVSQANSDADEELSLSIVEWAAGEIQRYVDTGSRAEEYLLAVLRFSQFQLKKSDAEDLFVARKTPDGVEVEATQNLEDILKKLGLQSWLASESRQTEQTAYIENEQLSKACCDLFARFLWQIASPTVNVGNGSHLLGELL